MPISLTQIRAALGALDWNYDHFSRESGVNKTTIAKTMKAHSSPNSSTMLKLEMALERAGIVFLPNDGVCKRPPLASLTLQGREGIRQFYDDVYESTKQTGKTIYIFNGIPSALIQWTGEDWYRSHAERMKSLQCVSKNIIEEGEVNLIGKSFALYKAVPKESFYSKTIYVYGDKFAFISFDEEILLKIIEDKDIAESFRTLIENIWQNSAKEIVL